jgi:hypothetical protein
LQVWSTVSHISLRNAIVVDDRLQGNFKDVSECEVLSRIQHVNVLNVAFQVARKQSVAVVPSGSVLCHLSKLRALKVHT